jgi:trans-aconitate 2-methyltransferase
MTWNPTDYLRFADERTRPAAHLVARVSLESPVRIIDLGCGPGNSTRVLKQRWPGAALTGLDSSKEMLAAAREALPSVHWVAGDIDTWIPEAPYDLVFANASLHWLPFHRALVGRLFGQVAPGGALAFQIPAAGDTPVRAHMREVAALPPWADRVAELELTLTMEPPHVYYDVLAPLARSVDIWETEYYHVMKSAADITAWFEGTSLRPILNALAEPERAQFKTLLTEKLAKAYSLRADGKVLFPFRRTFVVAYR